MGKHVDFGWSWRRGPWMKISFGPRMQLTLGRRYARRRR